MSLNTFPSRSSESFLSKISPWHVVILLTLVFWLSSSIVLDLVIMPGMYMAGMMSMPDFATAGYSIFWVFNRMEVICAATTLTGVFALWQIFPSRKVGVGAIALSSAMMVIALTATYWLTPEMGALGIHLNGLESVETIPNGMNLMHSSYFALDALKLIFGTTLTVICFRSFVNTTASGMHAVNSNAPNTNAHA